MQNPYILHFRTPEDFGAYLSHLAPPIWFQKVAIHHTEIPTVASWRGRRTMDGMLNFYQSKGWRSYPHIYIGPDGIWQMNNVLLRGTHTNAANPYSIAIEVVGNYNNDVWKEPIYSYTLDTILLLQRWKKLHMGDIILHRSYNSAKTCPGSAIGYDWIQRQLYMHVQNNTAPTEYNYRVKYDGSRIRQGPSLHYPIAGMLRAGDTFTSIAIKEDEFKETVNGETTWAHVTKAIKTHEQVDNLGFVHTSLLERI
jgi:hypothetical protein